MTTAEITPSDIEFIADQADSHEVGIRTYPARYGGGDVLALTTNSARDFQRVLEDIREGDSDILEALGYWDLEGCGLSTVWYFHATLSDECIEAINKRDRDEY